MKEEENRIRGISRVVCQYHYDERHKRGQLNYDEIVSKDKCALCKIYTKKIEEFKN